MDALHAGEVRGDVATKVKGLGLRNSVSATSRRLRVLWLVLALLAAALLRPREGSVDTSEAFASVGARQLVGSLLQVRSRVHTASPTLRSSGLRAPSRQQRLLRVLRRAEDWEQSDVSKLDLRVGQIVSAKNHPDPDIDVLVHQVDVGEEEPRQVLARVAKFLKPQEIEGRKVVIVTNLRERKVAGVKTHGMLLSASSASAAALVEAPEGAAVGERVKVEVEGELWGEAASVNQVTSKKILSKVMPDLHTDRDGVVCYRETSFMTSAGPCTATGLPHAVVS